MTSRASFLVLLSLCGAGCGGTVAARDVDCTLGSMRLPSENGPPASLLGSGLYCDAVGDVREEILEYTPRFPLWSDAASVRRFVHLPPGTAIDTTEEAHWSFPVGTRFWKEISLDGVVIETRLLERWGPGARDFTMMAYLWREDGSDADPVPGGAENVRGTTHDVPEVAVCASCHGNTPDGVLGFSAVQLGATDLPARLWAERKLTVPPREAQLPKEPTVLAALGYLHGNCGHCHYEPADGDPKRLGLRLLPGITDPAKTAAYGTAVGVPTVGFRRGTPRVRPGDPDGSAIVMRLSARGYSVQMPPIGTERVDETGFAAVRRWIAGM